MPSNIIYAIDFGTSNSLLAASSDGNVIAPISLDEKHQDSTILRSLMYFRRNGDVQFGMSAIEDYIDDGADGRFIRSIKKYLPAKSFTSTQIATQKYTLEELIGRFLREMKGRADRHFQEEVTSVVLGRPAKFSMNEESDELAQSRLEKAAKDAGFKEVSFFAEPLAAAYGFKSELKKEQIVLVVDLGGGTSDFTVIRLRPERADGGDVLSLGGVAVAGDALDGALMSDGISHHLGTKIEYQMPLSSNVLKMPADLRFRLMSPADITLMQQSDIMNFLREIRRTKLSSDDELRMERLFNLITDNLGFAIFEKIENCKRDLCIDGEAKFTFDDPGVDISENLTYEQFIEYSHDRISDVFARLDSVLKESGILNDDVDLICCTGGTSKVPAVALGLKERFGEEKIQTFKNFHSVIAGLAERARELQS